MQCNIDAKGKAVRLVSGVVVLLIGAALLTAAGVGAIAGVWPWVVGGVAAVGGGFQIFEAWAGWCVVRAMGFRTRI